MDRWPNSPVRYPDPAVHVLDPSFAPYRLPLAAVERLATGFRWAEGPVWFGDGRFLLWSDIPNNRVMKWEEETGAVSVFRRPSNNTNGNTRDRQGRLVSCEHDARRVTRTDYGGTITVVADRYQGKPLNSPNDVVCKSDGSVWFSDPPFGILGNYEGHVAEPELPTNVYRVDGGTGEVTAVTSDIPRPNGLCFSPDEKILYVNDTRMAHIRAFDVAPDGSVGNGRLFHKLAGSEAGVADGMKCDQEGNVYCTGPGGVHVIDPRGKLIGRLLIPGGHTTNIAWGDDDWRSLYMTTYHSVFRTRLDIPGVPVW